jgi:hypothetical protein
LTSPRGTLPQPAQQPAQRASRPGAYLGSEERKDRMDALLNLFVAAAAKHQPASQQETMAIAGNRSLLMEVVWGLRREFGNDAITTHRSKGYELSLATAERITALGDMPGLVDRLAQAVVMRRSTKKADIASGAAAQPRVQHKRQRLAAVTLHTTASTLCAEHFADNVFADDEHADGGPIALPHTGAAARPAYSAALLYEKTQRTSIEAILIVFAAHAAQGLVFQRDEALSLAGGEGLLNEVMLCLRREFGVRGFKSSNSLGYELAPVAAARFPALLGSGILIDRIMNMDLIKAAREHACGLRGGAGPMTQSGPAVAAHSPA